LLVFPGGFDDGKEVELAKYGAEPMQGHLIECLFVEQEEV
jgi:hypothetical protein